MIIIELQEDGIIREYNLPDRVREQASEFFDYLVEQEEILSWHEMPQ